MHDFRGSSPAGDRRIPLVNTDRLLDVCLLCLPARLAAPLDYPIRDITSVVSP